MFSFIILVISRFEFSSHESSPHIPSDVEISYNLSKLCLTRALHSHVKVQISCFCFEKLSKMASYPKWPHLIAVAQFCSIVYVNAGRYNLAEFLPGASNKMAVYHN